MSVPGERCGPGTVDVKGECVPAEGTSVDGGAPGTANGGEGEAGAGAASDDAGKADSESDGGASADASSGTDANVDVLTACFGTTNVMVLAGEAGNPLQEGAIRIEGGDGWSIETRGEQSPSTVVVHNGDWRMTFSSEGLDVPLSVATYIDVERAGDEAKGHAGLNVSHKGLACDVVTGRYSVLELETLPSDAATASMGNFIASFEQHCDNGPALRGCVHVNPSAH